MKECALILLLCLGLTPSVLACENEDCPPPAPPTPAEDLLKTDDLKLDLPFDFSVYAIGGWQRPDLQTLNQRLSGAGIQGFGEHQFSVGGGIQFSVGSILTEFQGWVNPALPAVNNEYVTSQYAGVGLFNLAYLLHPGSGIRLYPLVGIGFGSVDLDFNRRNVAADFDSFLREPGRQGKLSAVTLVLNLGLGMDFRVPLIEDWGLRLGLRGGFLWTPVPLNFWQTSNLFAASDSNNRNTAIPGGPGVGLTGPYAHLTLGF